MWTHVERFIKHLKIIDYVVLEGIRSMLFLFDPPWFVSTPT